MSAEKQPRLSFDKNKVGKYDVGPTGITATNVAGVTPTCELKASHQENGDLYYNGSEILNKNLDALGEKLMASAATKIDQAEPEDDYNWDDAVKEMNDIGEEQILQNLDRYIGLQQKKTKPKPEPKPEPDLPIPSSSERLDYFCRNCGYKYFNEDNFCGNCGDPRLK